MKKRYMWKAQSTCWLEAQSIFLFLSLETLPTALEEPGGKLLGITSLVRHLNGHQPMLLMEEKRDKMSGKLWRLRQVCQQSAALSVPRRHQAGPFSHSLLS